MPSCALVRYVLTSALRDRMFVALGLAVVVGAALSAFLGSAAVVEGDRATLVFAAAGLRIAGLIGVVLFVIASVRRAFESRDVEFLLSRPVSRSGFLLAHAAGFALIALMAAAAVSLTLWALGPHLAGPGTALWAASLAIEYVMMAAAALFFAMVVPSVTGAALATLGLYVLGRMSGQILGTIDAGGATWLERVAELISVLTPRLDLLGQSSWLVYGPEAAWPAAGFALAQGAAFTALVLVAALFDLQRRQF